MLIFYSSDENVLEIELKNHIQKYDAFDILYWTSTLEELYIEINQFSLNILPKIYIIKNVDFFSNKKKYFEVEKYLNLLSELNQNIIITTSKIMFDDSINNFLKKIKFNEFKKSNQKEIIKNYLYLSKISFDNEILEYISEKLPNNKIWIHNELNKIKLHNCINKDLVDNLILDYQNFEIFKMCESILSNNLQQTLKHYYYSIQNNISIEEILSILSSYFVKIYILKKALNLENNINIITEKYQINKFWFNNIYYFLKNISINKLKYILNNLFKFDLSLKTINLDKYLNFKLLLLNFFKE